MSTLRYLTEREVAQRFGLSTQAIQKWRRQDRGPAYFKMEGTVRYRLEDIEAYERKTRITPSEAEASDQPGVGM